MKPDPLRCRNCGALGRILPGWPVVVNAVREGRLCCMTEQWPTAEAAVADWAEIQTLVRLQRESREKYR